MKAKFFMHSKQGVVMGRAFVVRVVVTVCFATVGGALGQRLGAVPAYELPRRHVPETIVTHTGQLFTITLPAQPSTGYTWYLVSPVTEDFVKLLGKTTMPCRCIGGRTTTTFTFQADHPGHEFIRFEYSRPWSWSSIDSKAYQVVIRSSPRHQAQHPVTLPGSLHVTPF